MLRFDPSGSSASPLWHRVLDFRRDPHSAARTVLLEMHLIHGPQINRLVVYERVQFFYKRSVAADPLRLRRGEVFAAGNSTGGTGADTAALPNSRLTAGVEMQPRFCRPRGWLQSSRPHWGFGARRLRSGPIAWQLSGPGDPTWAARLDRRILCARIGSPNTQ